MAIFSQDEIEASIDFRNYNSSKPLKQVPYSLPKELEDKLNKLTQKMKLNTGSIDMIVDEFGNYTFLEINPIGQITMTSQPCNYYLEKKIAECL